MNYFNNRFSWEWKLLDFFYQNSNSFTNTIAFLISLLGSGYFTVLVIGIIYYGIDKNKGELIAFWTLTSMLFNGLLKSLFFAKRPFEFTGFDHYRKLPNLDGATGTSFPSGHSQNCSSLSFSLMILFKSKLVKTLAIIMLVLIPISRIALGVHFPGDVIIGLLLGTGIVLGLSFLTPIFNKSLKTRNLILLIITLIFLPVIIINLQVTKTHDFFSAYGLFIGFSLGTFIEKKYINFKVKVSLQRRILRVVIGMIGLGIIYLITSWFFKKALNLDNNLTGLIRYTLISFSAFGAIPWCFTKEEEVKNHEK